MTRAGHAEPRKRPRQERSRQTVERILDAAARIFDERGYRSATTNHVADAAGVSIGSLYQYFPNKDALLVGLAERHLDEVGQAFGARLAAMRRSEPPVPEVVRSLVELTADLNESSRLHALLWSDCPRTPDLQAQLDRFTGHVVAEVTHHLDRTGTGGRRPVDRARLLVAATDAAVHDVVLSHPPGRTRRAVLDDLIDILARGIS